MAKSNELFVLNNRRPGDSDSSLKTVRGRFISLRTPEDVAAAKELEYSVVQLRVKMIDRGAQWELRNIIVANNNPLDVSPFIDRDQSRIIAQEVTKIAE
jgi:hypothetical protein